MWQFAFGNRAPAAGATQPGIGGWDSPLGGETSVQRMPRPAPNFIHDYLPKSCGLAHRQRGRSGLGLIAQSGPIHEAQMTVHVFHQRSATLDPIAVVAVKNAVDITH